MRRCDSHSTASRQPTEPHTHSGPGAYAQGLFATISLGSYNPRFFDFLVDRISALLEEAQKIIPTGGFGYISSGSGANWTRRENMAAFKVPRIVEFIDALPKSGSGKIQWRELQDRERRAAPERSAVAERGGSA